MFNLFEIIPKKRDEVRYATRTPDGMLITFGFSKRKILKDTKWELARREVLIGSYAEKQ
jgi:hypothetical protein